ncbi:hypothetical protein [Lederbergia citri]|uniref:Uncharacterized protein n=1 Tax=Lederbergia citri TaxID=2833580 RepID=A0A942YG66_9BACI|nr:hypothetical protein [Lederbergia citri]MBS4194359.1 hypothetical protein [Lederbergia citri]
MEQKPSYIDDYKFYYGKSLLRNYDSKVVLGMIKLMNGNRRSSFTIKQLAETSGVTRKVARSTVYKMIDECMENHLVVDFIPADFSANERFVVQFPYDLVNFSFLYELEIDELLELETNEIRVFLVLFGFIKNSNIYKQKNLKRLRIGRSNIAHYSGVKNLNSLTNAINSLEEKNWIKITDKGNNLKERTTEYEILKDYEIR